MSDLVADVKAVYQKEGPTVLFLKGLRTIAEPLIGFERAYKLQYKIARKIFYRQWSMPKVQLPEDRITIKSKEANIFFGFYDHTPFCPRNERVLYNKTEAEIAPISPEDTLELCYYDLNTGETTTFAETRTWNWQKGCRLHWHPTDEDVVVYNTLINDEYGAICHNIRTREIVRKYQHPIYDTDPNGRYALSVNFSRLERLHYDYGYTNLPDETREEATPPNDGIYRLDLDTGETTLLVSYKELAEFIGIPDGVHNYVMNLMISPTGKWVSVLHRYHYKGDRKTELLAISADSGDMELLQDHGEASHPFWRTDTELLSTVNFWGDKRRTEFVLYDLESGQRHRIEHPELNVDSHPHISPVDPSRFVGDTYPDYCGDRHLYIFDIDTNQYELIGKVYGPVFNDTKRDLHPRWDRTGEFICFDIPLRNNNKSISFINSESI